MGDEARGGKLERSATRPPPRCPRCGHPLAMVWVHGHGQCAHCGMNIESCCEGAPLPTGEAERASRQRPDKSGDQGGS